MSKLYLVSIGPGDLDLIVPRAQSALQNSSVIIGHQLYLDLIAQIIKDKETISTPLGQELERVDLAIEHVLQGKPVSLISSGDIGVYGLAGLALERLNQQKHEIDVEIIPGVTSATACGSLLGAPLTLDFLTLSLSDILVPREQILKRAKAAAEGDFVSVLYNVQSAQRKGLIYEVLEKFRPHRSPETPCGVVANAYREKQNFQIVNFENLFDMNFNMLTTLIIGNESTIKTGQFMVAKRGYSLTNES